MKSILHSLILMSVMVGLESVGPVEKSWAQAAPQTGPAVDIAITDALVGPMTGGRKVQRDDKGNLVSFPGDSLRFTLTATNVGTEAAHEVEMVDPIPPGTVYLPNSAKGESMTITFSIDGGKTYQENPMIDVKKPDGTMEKKPAPMSMYTHVKWVIARPIQPKEKVRADMLVKVKAQ